MSPTLHWRNILSPQHFSSPSGQPLVSPLWILLYLIPLLSTGIHPKPLPHTQVSLLSPRPRWPTALNEVLNFHLEISQAHSEQDPPGPHPCTTEWCESNLESSTSSLTPPLPHPTTISSKSKLYLLDITQRTPLLPILHTHSLPQLRSPPSLTFRKVRVSTAGLRHPGRGGGLGPTGLGHKGEPWPVLMTPCLTWAFPLETLQPASSFRPSDQMLM